MKTFSNETVEDRATNRHTPGPWNYDRMLLPPNAEDRRCGFVVNGPDESADLPTRICDLRVPCGVSGFAEGEANAKLIAAAPELLAVLVKIVSRATLVPCKDGGKDAEADEPGSMVSGKWRVESSIDGWIAEARAAIAKATDSTADDYQGAGHYDHHQD